MTLSYYYKYRVRPMTMAYMTMVYQFVIFSLNLFKGFNNYKHPHLISIIDI